jgi:hypothetical protein
VIVPAGKTVEPRTPDCPSCERGLAAPKKKAPEATESPKGADRAIDSMPVIQSHNAACFSKLQQTQRKIKQMKSL